MNVPMRFSLTCVLFLLMAACADAQEKDATQDKKAPSFVPNYYPLEVGNQWTFAIDPVNPQVLYTNSGYGTNSLYKSSNGGVDWDVVWPPADKAIAAKGDGFAGYINIDRKNHNHLLLTFHNPCADGAGCFAETQDAGATWNMIVGQPAFEAQARIYLLDSTTWLVPSNGSLYRSTDSGANWTKVADIIAGGHSAGHMVRATNGTYYIGTTYGVIRSPDGIAWNLIPQTGSWVDGITSDGVTIFASVAHAYLTSPESDGLTWTLGAAPQQLDLGARNDYDPGHHMLVASMGHLFRMVTR